MSDCGSITNSEILSLLFVIAPQFVTIDVDKLAQYNLLIDVLRCQINCKLLGCCAILAFANLLAHYLTMQSNPYMGIQTNITEGQLSLGLANTVNANFFAASPYGQAYNQLVSNFKIGAFVTNANRRWSSVGPYCCGGY